METISTTKLARKFSLSNRELEAKLKDLGVKPLQSIEISGRKFATWDRETAETKLRERKQSASNATLAPLKHDLEYIKQRLDKIVHLLQPNEEVSAE